VKLLKFKNEIIDASSELNIKTVNTLKNIIEDISKL
jgi:hypothetical protein